MSELGLVSVILPTFNRARSITRAIESVLSQTYTNLELIIVDDGSTDETAEIISNCGDNRLHYMYQPRNQGAHMARNLGIESASGEYITFQDSDDQWNPSLLDQHMVNFRNCPDAGVSVIGAVRISSSGNKRYIPKRSRRVPGGCHVLTQQLLGGSFIATPMLAIESRLLKEVGVFDADRMHLMEDWELAIRLSTCTKFAVSTKVLHISYDSYDNITNTSNGKQAEAILNIINKHLGLYSQWPTEQSMQYLRISAYYFSSAEYRLGLNYLRQALQCGNSSPLPAFSAMAKLIHRTLVDLLPDTGHKVENSNEKIQRDF